MGDLPLTLSSNSIITESKPHEYRIGRVLGLIIPSSPYLFSLLTFLLWASLSSFLVASDPSPGIPVPPPEQSLLNPFEKNHHSVIDQKLGLAIGISLLLFFVGLTLVIIMICFPKFRFINLRRKRSVATSAVHDEEEQGQGQGRNYYNDCYEVGVEKDVCFPTRFSWVEMEKFTSNFSSVIGSGGFSTVYLAQFPDSTLGAIKIHSSSSERLNRVFKQELEILIGLKHENIVKFLGYCDEREEGVLVFEYVPNGNLQEKLHNQEAVLPWKSRMAIAYQLAQAIEYLHEKCPLQIVHGDVKASNILLDDKFNCKLCDFGSAKMGFSSTVLPPSSSPRANRMMMMMGSPGYTDPHYLRTGIASKKNDLYSFGVVVLELITGMEALCSENGERLTSIAGPILKDDDESRVVEMLDSRLGIIEGGFDFEEVMAMASIARMCLCDSATLRPSAADIVNRMRSQIPCVSALLPLSSLDEKL